MSLAIAHPTLLDRSDAPAPPDPSIQQQVWAVLAGIYPRGKAAEKRSSERFPYPNLLYLSPVDEDAKPLGSPVVVVGKHLCEKGLGFYHFEPLPHRLMIASLELPQSQWAGFLIDVRWTRFTCFGVYDSGAKFIETATSPMMNKVAS